MDRAVAYKPLSSEAIREDQDDDEDEDSPPNDEHYYHHQGLARYCVGFLGLKEFRSILYILSFLLTIIFLALLSLRDSPTGSSSTDHPLTSTSMPADVRGQHNNSQELFARTAALYMKPSDIAPSLPSASSHVGNSRPKYSDYMSSIVGIRESDELTSDDLHTKIQTNESQGIHGTESNSTTWWVSNLRSNFVTVTDYIRANKSFNHNSSLTLTTQATIEFLYHSLELCKRWDGPISLAVYVPGNEFRVALTLIKYMRQCLPVPLSACIRDKITWHLVYDKAHGPSLISLGAPAKYLDVENFPLFVEQDQCPKLAGPNPVDLIRQFEEELRKRNGLFPDNYRQQFKLTYPINVLRNTARLAADTKYLLASDVELYPSINLVPQFINYISQHNIRQEYNYVDRFVFTLPIFEVQPTKSAPKTKNELVEMIQLGDAIFFHKWVCDACQAFPNRLDWLQMNKFGQSGSQSQQQDDELIVFEVTQRDRAKNSWEPIFIGTNDDPLYDDRLSWDGRRDKMGQMFEMCLRNYYLFVIGNAFLVHAPGIKHIDRNDVAKRYNYMRDNNLIYDATMERLRKQYANSSNIDKC